MGMTTDENTGASQEMTLEQQIEQHRDLCSKQIKYAEITAKKAVPPVVQEIVLAQRHLEDARMRFGVALTKLKGFDPWVSQVKKEK